MLVHQLEVFAYTCRPLTLSAAVQAKDTFIGKLDRTEKRQDGTEVWVMTGTKVFNGTQQDEVRVVPLKIWLGNRSAELGRSFLVASSIAFDDMPLITDCEIAHPHEPIYQYFEKMPSTVFGVPAIWLIGVLAWVADTWIAIAVVAIGVSSAIYVARRDLKIERR